jgi:hypothetical protein
MTAYQDALSVAATLLEQHHSGQENGDRQRDELLAVLDRDELAEVVRVLVGQAGLYMGMWASWLVPGEDEASEAERDRQLALRLAQEVEALRVAAVLTRL